MKKSQKKDVTVIMGDFNAKVGRQQDSKVKGRFGLGGRNNAGGKLVDNKLCIANTIPAASTETIHMDLTRRDVYKSN